MDKVIVNSQSELLKSHNVSKGDEITKESAQQIADAINNSHKGKAIVEGNELKVKDLLIG